MLLRTLVAEHLGCDPDDVPEDPHELFDAMVACADALDEWYAGGAPDEKSGIRGRLDWAGCRTASHRSPRRWPAHLPGHLKRRERVRPARTRCRAGRERRRAHPDGCAGWRHRS